MIGTCRAIGLVILLLVGSSVFATPPVHFIENKKQWPEGFRFGADFPQMRVMLKDASIFFVQHSKINKDGKTPVKVSVHPVNESHVHSAGETAVTTFELSFLDARRPSISASQKQITTYNYFFGNDPSLWTSNASSYGEVKYSGMYDGIDLKVYGQSGQMKYDWIVSPCADVKKIRFWYKGAEHIEIRDENLVVASKLGEVVETKPYAYQVVNGERREVPAAFEIDDHVVSFIFPSGYDSNYELVIDPFLIFSSYSGSTFDNWGNTATPDSRGNLYSGGMVLQTSNGKFPTTPGAYQVSHNGGSWDVGILKYDSVGAKVLYATYLGGSGTETPQSLVVNSNDELLILGATSSDDFPVTTADTLKGGTTVDPLDGVLYTGGTDLFIARLSSNGSQLLASTYLGGKANDGINFEWGDIGLLNHGESPLARNYGDQFRGDIITTPDGSVFIATNTLSSDFPVFNSDPNAQWHGGTHDAVVAKLTPNLTPVWSRLVGGSGTDAAYSIKITKTGNILVAGGTTSTNLAGMNGLHTAAPGNIDGWIAELSSSGEQIINSTYIGTNQYDQVYFIDITTTGDVIAYGQTKGSYPITPADVYSKPNSGQFIHKLSADLKNTMFSTTFGKGTQSPDISPTAFLVNACDNIFVAGWGGSINATKSGTVTRNYMGGNTFNLPVTADAWQPLTHGHDFYLMVLGPDARELIYATFLGGTQSRTHVDGGTSRFDKRGIVYHAVCASCGGLEDDFPAYNVPVSRSSNPSPNCNNAAFKFDLSSLRAGLRTNNLLLTSPGLNKVCLPDGIMFQNIGIGGEIFEWDFGDGFKMSVDNQNNIYHKYINPGKYTIKLKAIDRSTCVGVDSVSTVVDVFLPKMSVGPDQRICYGSSTNLHGEGGVSYEWKTVDNLTTLTGPSPLLLIDKETTYRVTITDINGCVKKDTVTVDVIPGIDPKFNLEVINDCLSRPGVKITNLTELREGEESEIFFGDGTSTTETDVFHTYGIDDNYTVSVRGTTEHCVYESTRTVPIYTLTVPNVITPGTEDQYNDVLRIEYGNPPVARTDLRIQMKIMNRWGVKVFESSDYQDNWKGENVDSGVYYYEIVLGESRCKGWIHLIK